jgi:hypothetical protein
VFFGITTDPEDQVTAPSFGAAKSASITITVRYFTGASKSVWRWCPPGPTCNPATSYFDLTTTVQVGFRDNILRETSLVGDTAPDRLFGKLYFYNTFLPQGSF